MLEELIGRCNVRQLELTNAAVARHKPVMYSDFTRSFPRVLSIYVFSFLDPRSLCRCAQVTQTLLMSLLLTAHQFLSSATYGI